MPSYPSLLTPFFSFVHSFTSASPPSAPFSPSLPLVYSGIVARFALMDSVTSTATHARKTDGRFRVPRDAHHHRQPHRQKLRSAHHPRHHPGHGPAPDQNRRRRFRHDELRPRLSTTPRPASAALPTSTATKASCVTAAIPSKNSPKKAPTSKLPTCFCTANCPPKNS